MQGLMGSRTVIGGRERDYFSGTGYLGLQSHPEVLGAAQQALAQYGLTTGTSRGGYGEHPLYDELEYQVQQTFGVDRMRYFASGYLGNTILVQGLKDHYDCIFIDEASHFSVWDGARTIERKLTPFPHRDTIALADAMRKELKAGQRPLVISDGVFPISGEIAPLPEYLKLVEAYDGFICLDDAHAGGVLGSNGCGTLEHFKIHSERCIASFTLSKAFGGFGGLIPCQQGTVEELDRNSRVYVAASPPPLPMAAASSKGLELARLRPQEFRLRLWDNVTYARNGFRRLGWDLPDSSVPILCLGRQAGLDLAVIKAKLLDRDLCVAHVSSYSSTPQGGALRIAIFATHTKDQIDRLIYEMAKLI
jgi:glycine C-acetyltransferase/8-amino-7-oxononanoate synthase